MSAIVIEGLRKNYGEVVALDGLDLCVDKGAIFGFLGPNGAGKTTTLRILAGLAHPTAGQAWIEGASVGPESPARKSIGYLPEEPSFYPWMTAQEFLADLVGGLHNMPRSAAKERSEEMLGLVGLEEAAGRRIGGFSRGMRQRLGLAQAFMNRPQVLLLDEPVSALDPSGRHSILSIIEELGKEATIFMSTHILDDVERICDTIGILDRGRLIVVDSREDLIRQYAVPIIEVVFDAEPEAVRSWAESLREMQLEMGIRQEGSEVRISFDGSSRSSAEIQRLALGADMSVLSYQHVRPQLEDVFLQLVE
ncbi:MAG: ATP-binding cassette domain-containing protein [Anaerolineales bacterium]|nr:ATP-binding cassette domain-containing protein [Anaerolineales bacterium]